MCAFRRFDFYKYSYFQLQSSHPRISFSQSIMSKPAIVLAHGAWHTPEAFGLVTKRLEDAGYSVHGRKLPSVGNDNPPEDLSRDITAVQELVTEAIGDGNDVIVIPHSWAGIIVASALSGWGKKEREERGLKGGVVKFAYICAFMIPENVSLMDAIQHQVPHWWDFDVSLNYASPPPCTILDTKTGTLYHCQRSKRLLQ